MTTELIEATSSNPVEQDQAVEQQLEQARTLLQFEGEITTANSKAVLAITPHAKGEVIRIEPSRIVVMEGFNPRIRDAGFSAHIRSIAESIKEEGFYPSKPLAGIAGMRGKDPVIYLTDGHCRLEATMLAIQEGAPIRTVPIILSDRATTMEDLTVQFARGNEGKRLTPLELAVVVKRLTKFSWSPKLIATKLGFSEEYVNQLLQIAGAPMAIRNMIAEGAVPAAVAVAAIKTHGAEATQVLNSAVEKAKATGKTGITRKHLPEQQFKKAMVKIAPDLVATAREITAHPGFEQFPPEIQNKLKALLSTLPHDPA